MDHVWFNIKYVLDVRFLNMGRLIFFCWMARMIFGTVRGQRDHLLCMRLLP